MSGAADISAPAILLIPHSALITVPAVLTKLGFDSPLRNLRLSLERRPRLLRTVLSLLLRRLILLAMMLLHTFTLYALISFSQILFLNSDFVFSLTALTDHHTPNIFNKIVIQPCEKPDFTRIKFPVVTIVQSATTLSPRNIINSGMFIIEPMTNANNLNRQSTPQTQKRREEGIKLLKVEIYPLQCA